jgi:GTP cyclohydrolase I
MDPMSSGSRAPAHRRRQKGVLMVLDLDDEEDRDKEAVLEFMKRYAKLWRNLFAKYQNVGHKQTKIRDFD